MSFYRKATEEDFQRRARQLEKFIPNKIRELIETHKVVNGQIVTECKNITGQSMIECKEDCEKYLAYVRAKEDFQNGKDVYTEYP